MTNKLTLLGAVLVAVLLTLPSLARSSQDLEPFDANPMAPVLVYDVSGMTLGGPIGKSLVVYNNGRVQISEAANFLRGPYVDTAKVSPRMLEGLLAELEGWSFLDDETQQALDLPLQTLTTIDKTGQARSVSWWTGHGGHQHLESAVDRLVAELFPLALK